MNLLRKISNRFYSTHQNPQTMFYMNDKVRDSFYLANASLNDHIDWFIQSAHELMFPDLVKNYQRLLKMNSQANSKELEEDLTNASDEMEYTIQSMQPCNMLMEVNFPIRKTSGYVDVIKGFMGQHCVFNEKIDYIGGFRMCPDLNRDCIKSMSILSSYRHALYNIELAGAHFGLKICPNSLPTSDLKNIVENYICELKQRTSSIPPLNFLTPDINTDFEQMNWINEYNNKSKDISFISIGNSYKESHYEDAGGRSTLFFLKEFLNDAAIINTLGINAGIQKKTFILEGLGKLGYSIGKLMEEHGAMCVGIKEKDSSVYIESGISIEDIMEFKQTYGTLLGYNEKVLPQESPQIYTEPCDIMIFAATHRTLQCYNADKIKAKVIIEAADCALTPAAHKKLTSIGRLVIPDLMAGVGPTIATYIEYLKNYNKRKYELLRNKYIKLEPTIAEPELINAMFDTTLHATLAEVLITRNRYKLDWDFKMACFATAIQNIFNRKLRNVNHKIENTKIMQ